MSVAWLRKKVRHPWLGGPHRLTMYLATLDCAISNPSLSSSPVDTGRSPKRVVGAHALDQRAEVSFDLRSPSQWGRDFHRHELAESLPEGQRTSVPGLMIVRTCRIDGNQRYSWIKNQNGREPNATVHFAPQNDQLMSESRNSRLQAGSST